MLVSWRHGPFLHFFSHVSTCAPTQSYCQSRLPVCDAACLPRARLLPPRVDSPSNASVQLPPSSLRVHLRTDTSACPLPSRACLLPPRVCSRADTSVRLVTGRGDEPGEHAGRGDLGGLGGLGVRGGGCAGGSLLGLGRATGLPGGSWFAGVRRVATGMPRLRARQPSLLAQHPRTWEP